MPRKVCGMPFGGLGVLERSLFGEGASCCRRDRDRARRRCGGGGGASLDTGDARADAKDEATMALDRASSLMPFDSCTTLELLLCDSADSDPMLGVFARIRDPPPTGFFLIEPAEDTMEEVEERAVEDRGGSAGLKSSVGAAVDRGGSDG